MPEAKRRDQDEAPGVFRTPGVKQRRTSTPGELRLPHEDLIRPESEVTDAAVRADVAVSIPNVGPATRESSVPSRAGKGSAGRRSRAPMMVEGAVGSDENPPSCETLPAALAHYETLWQVLEYSEPRLRALRVFFNLAGAGKNRKCYIKSGQLERWAKMEERQARQTVASLRSIGWIKKVREYDGRNKLGPLYEIPLELPKSIASQVAKFKLLQSF